MRVRQAPPKWCIEISVGVRDVGAIEPLGADSLATAGGFGDGIFPDSDRGYPTGASRTE